MFGVGQSPALGLRLLGPFSGKTLLHEVSDQPAEGRPGSGDRRLSAAYPQPEKSYLAARTCCVARIYTATRS
jgi:hypothetical protein